MNFRVPISLIIKELILNLAKVREKRALPLYAGKERQLPFYGQKVSCLHLAGSKRVIAKIEMRPKKYERVLPLYASKKKGLAKISRNPGKLYVHDNK